MAYRRWRTVRLEERIKSVEAFVKSILADKEILKPQISQELGKSYRNVDEEFRRIEEISFSLI